MKRHFPEHTEDPIADALTREEIVARAHALYLERGGVGGHDLEDWLHAEQEVLDEVAPTLSA